MTPRGFCRAQKLWAGWLAILWEAAGALEWEAVEGDPPVGHPLELGIPAARRELFGQAETEALGSWAVSRSPSSLHLSSLRSSFLRPKLFYKASPGVSLSGNSSEQTLT